MERNEPDGHRPARFPQREARPPDRIGVDRDARQAPPREDATLRELGRFEPNTGYENVL